jgi:carboxyl-terminal processing protease
VGWQAGPGWQANQQPPTFGGSGTPPAAAGTLRRPSRLPGYLAVIAACLIAFSGGMVVDHSFFPRTVSSGDQPASSAAPVGSAENSALYNEALQIIKSRFVGRSSVTDQQLLYGAIKGMVDSLGDTGHSTFLTPAQYAAFQQSLSASVAGIGVIMSSANNVFRVDRVIAGSPAAAGGVKVGDTITAVGGTSTTDMTLTDLGSKIRGPAGTKVTITVLHAGSTTAVDITLIRAAINVPLTGWGMVPGTHIADIVLVEFSTGAADQVQQDITEAQKAGATSIVLDLRGNPGGYAQEAQDVASEFLSSGIVYIVQDANGNNTDISVDTSRTHTDLPLVVLVDHDSASSSEIVAGALQDSARAKIVGVATFGTGTVLQQFQLSDGSYIILGTSWWLTPHGHKIFGVGIQPDETVPMAAGTLPADPTTFGTMTVAQLNASGDAELLAAVKDLSK